MKDIFFTIIIKDSDNLAALDAVNRQNWNNYECFIVNNSIKDLEKYIVSNNRFHIIENKSDDKYKNINTAIEQGNGEYFIILNSSDILTQNSLADISRIANLTDAQIIEYNTMYVQNVSGVSLDEQQCIFNYLIRRKIIMESVFDSMSAFCFSHSIIKKQILNLPEHVFIMNLLKDTPSIAKTNNTYLLQLAEHNKIKSEEYIKIVDNYKKIENEFDNNFWRNYFKKIIPGLMMATVSEKRRDAFVYCCKNIPLKFIPLKYRFMFSVMKTF